MPPPTPPSATRSLGHFLCHHPPDPPLEDVDRLPLRDIKQDACLRAIVALRRAGKPVGPDPVAAFDAEPRLVMLAYRRAYHDALRHHLGRGRDQRAARWRRLVSLDHGLADLADPRQQEAFDQVLTDIVALGRLLALWHATLPGATPAQTRRILRLMRQAQRLKAEGTTVVPDHLRQQLRLLRQATGLALATRLL